MLEENININTNLYSRQIGAYGLETMIKLSKMNIFIYGMRGVGVEVTKNIILAGPKRVTIYDNNISKINDLTSNFFINEKDVLEEKRRDEASFPNLLKLNPYVTLNIMNNSSIIDHLKEKLNIKEEKYDVVVITEFMSKNFIIELDNFCRQNKIGFIYGTELGINGFCFVDFGDNFTVYEKNEEEPKKFIVNSITKGNPGIVNLFYPINNLSLQDNDYIIFKEIQGMTELNNCSPIKIKVIDKYNVQIIDTTKFSDYISGGIMIKATIPLIMNFDSFEKKIEEPYSNKDPYPDQIDFVNPNTNEIVHIGILGLCSFYNIKSCLPEINNENDAIELINLSKNILIEKENKKEYWINGLKEETENFDELFEKTIKNLSLWSKTQISPISSFLGGLIAQEIVKFTGKFIPIKQWFWCNFSEILENLNGKIIDREIKGTRYDNQIAIFGNEIQKKLEKTNIFMIGAGALGCEFLKLFALMGISTDKDKQYKVTVTDNDNIIESNLNRQFLFRNEDIGKSKSKVACEKVININKFFNCVDLQSRIGPENENIFNDEFWDKQTFIINAVDNIEARKYIANQCILYQKILIDSGTNGTKANSQVIIPHKTVGYSPPLEKIDDQIPMCTLRNFPSSIEHCIEWARDNFNTYFVNIINEVKFFFEDKEKYYNELSNQGVPKEQIIKLNKIVRYAKMLINKDFRECLKIALEEYNESFYDSIIRILINHPLNSLNQDGSKFWSGDKRCPTPLVFNIDNNLAFLFVKIYAKILAKSMSIPFIDDDESLKKILLEIKTEIVHPEIQLKEKNKKLIYKDNDLDIEFTKEKKLELKKKKAEEIKIRLKKDKEELIRIKEIANNLDISEIRKNIKSIFNIQDFEKDDDKNGHIDFIYAASNLRAQIFKIENCNKIKAKLIAGKIIPSIATTTASIAGLVSLQLFTLYQTNEIEFLRDDYFNFSINAFNFCYPGECEEIKKEESIQLVPEKYTIWDFIEINESFTIKNLIEYIKNKYKVNVTSITCYNKILYSIVKQTSYDFNEDNFSKKKIEKICAEIFKDKVSYKKKFIILNVNGNINNLKAKMPLFKYYLK